ncbi:ATPase involved in DNA repair [Nostoc sp. DSM 114167]
MFLASSQNWVEMKTIEELKTRIKELSSQAVKFSKKATEVCLTNREQAKHFRQQAREASKRCQLLIQELKRQ